MPSIQVNYKRVYYKEWKPEEPTKSKGILLMVGRTFFTLYTFLCVESVTFIPFT